MDFRFTQDTMRDVLSVIEENAYTAAYKIVNNGEETWARVDGLSPTVTAEYCDVVFPLDHTLIGDGEVTEVRLYKDAQSGGELICGVEGISIYLPNATDDIVFRMRIRAQANLYDYSISPIQYL